MVKSLNIPRTDTIFFQTVLNTLQDTAELHDHLSVKIGADNTYRQRRADIRKHVHQLEAQLDTIETSLADVEADVRTNKMDHAIYERVKANLTTQRQSILVDQEQATVRYNQLNADDQLLSALSSMTIDMDRFDANFSDKKKRDWLSKIVERVDVNYLHDTKEHEVNLRLKIPLFSDEFLGIQTYKTDDFIKPTRS